MLGRVSSLDWLISIGLLPLSFALTAPIAGLIGVRATLVGAAVIGGAVTLGALFLPGMRDIEGQAAGVHGGPPHLDPEFLRPPALVDLQR
jgi:DHA3 family tetracycline resistance protein-like MFS transporter